ncbi:MAG: choice-of-anchor Q domain-containing protein [Gemmata sp.]
MLQLERLEDREVPALYTVTTLADAGTGSLRDAVTQANASTGVADTINFSQGLSGVVYLETALPALSDDITIDGPGATLVALIRSPNADPSFGFFQVNNGVTAFISGLKMAGASSTAVTNFGTLTLNHVLIENNTGSGNVSGLTSGDPGGIGNTGTLTVLYSTIANNNANLGQVAGGIHSESGSVTVVNSTISGNVANNTNGAGGIGVYGGTATISNSTITLNQANNSSPNTSGGGLDAFGSSVVLVNTVVAGNSSTTTSSDVSGTVTSGGGNFIGVNNGATGFNANDQVGTNGAPLDARLGPLAMYGGSTPTHLPQPGSLLIDRGVNSGVSGATGAADQRGFTPRIFNGTVDIGAVEVGATSPLSLLSIVDDVGGGPVTAGSVVTFTVTFSEEINAFTVTTAAFSNAGTAGIVVNSATETPAMIGVFTVVVTTTSAGTLRLQIPAGTLITNVAGDPLDTTTPLIDDTTIIVTAAGPLVFGNPGTPGRLLDPETGGVRNLTDAFPGYRGPVLITLGDVSGDGVPDAIVLAQNSPGGHVKAIDGATGAELLSFMAYEGFRGDVSIAVGDVNGDGFADILTGAAGHVKVFSGEAGTVLWSFMAYQGFRGTISVAAGDVDGDRHADIVVGTGAGISGGHIKVFDGVTTAEVLSFLAYPGFMGGVNVAAGDLNGDGLTEILTGTASGPPHVRSFAPNGAPLDSFFAPGVTGNIGVLVLAADSDGDGLQEIVFLAPNATYESSIFGWRGTPE